MAISRTQKEEQLTELKEKMQNASSVVFAHYIGLSVGEVSDLRSKLRDAKAEMKVAKKTLMRLAGKDLQFPELSDDVMEGPVACIFSYEDPLSGAQVAFKFAKDHKQVELIGGVYEGSILTKEEAVALAKMPNRETLLAMFASMMRAPLQNFASACGSPMSSFARGLREMAEKKAATA